MSPDAKPARKPAKATASTKIVKPITPAEALIDRFTVDGKPWGIVRSVALKRISLQLRRLTMPPEEVDRIMAEIRASLGVDDKA